jgi:hypothetical protein
VYRDTEKNYSIGFELYDSPEPRRHNFDIEENVYSSIDKRSIDKPWLARLPLGSIQGSPDKFSHT